MRIFELDVKKIGVLLLPTLLRRAKMVAWVRSLLMPLDNLHGRFIGQREHHLYNLSINGQKCYLRKALNDKFDRELRRITIDDASKYKSCYLFTQEEQQDFYLDEDEVFLYTGEEYVDTGVNFTVRIPAEYEPFDLSIRALLDYYKLASKKYIIYYE